MNEVIATDTSKHQCVSYACSRSTQGTADHLVSSPSQADVSFRNLTLTLDTRSVGVRGHQLSQKADERENTPKNHGLSGTDDRYQTVAMGASQSPTLYDVFGRLAKCKMQTRFERVTGSIRPRTDAQTPNPDGIRRDS